MIHSFILSLRNNWYMSFTPEICELLFMSHPSSLHIKHEINIIYSLFPFNLPHFPAAKMLTQVKGHLSNFIFNFHNFWGSMPLSPWGGWCPWHHIWRLICSWKYHYLTAIQLQSSEAHPVEGNKRRSWSIKKLKRRVNTRTNFNSFSLCSRLQGNPEVLIKQKGSGIFHKANHTTGWFINSWMPLAFR